MTTVARKFGTDLSNVDNELLVKRLSSKTKDMSKEKKSTVPPGFSELMKSPMPSAVKHVQIDEELNSLVAALDTQATVSETMALAKSFKYEPSFTTNESKQIFCRDYLLQFQQTPSADLEISIPEIRRGYIAPKPKMAYIPPGQRQNRSNPTTPIGYNKMRLYQTPSPHSKSLSNSVLSTPGGGVQFVSMDSPSDKFLRHLTTHSAFADFEKGQVQSPIIPAAKMPEVEEPVSDQPDKIEEVNTENNNNVDKSDAQAPLASVPLKNLQLEWRIKKVKKDKPRESNERRLAARQKQIDIGKATAGYKAFMEQVPKSQRTKEHPRTPNKYQVCSKRSWDGQVRKWRRMLHQYDPPGTAPATIDEKDLDLEVDIVCDSDEELDEVVEPESPVLGVAGRKVAINLEKVFEEENISV